ncbi:hypothetical protein Bca52824_019264 [Brassica carinata]|uniref:Uncharacterized protein n=1 Tax=Brassica carinata TaxID=52824 RepID=A0A8X7VS56_BRACI|nr:hypothetical protein Bca52824_019264 [Brassica carinata]
MLAFSFESSFVDAYDVLGHRAHFTVRFKVFTMNRGDVKLIYVSVPETFPGRGHFGDGTGTRNR